LRAGPARAARHTGGNMARKLLLADDSVTIQKVVGISFANEDVDLITVDNGDTAIQRAREVHPDVVLADVVMPGKSGYEVCEAIKTDPLLRHVPVLLLTGTFEAFDEERARRCGAAGHVAKPFEAQALVDRVKALLAQAPPAPPAPAEATTAPSRPSPTEAAGNVRIGQVVTQTVSSPTPSSESFDFFDDAPGSPTPPPAAATDPEPGPGRATAADAFAFGEDELLGAEPEPTADRTVALLGDELDAAPAQPTPASFDDPFEADLGGDDLLPREKHPTPEPAVTRLDPSFAADDGGDELLPEELISADSTASRVEDSFDFDLGQSQPGEVSGPQLAQATVLDPKGSSGFDVSSSDLGDPLAEAPVGPVSWPAAAGRPAAPPAPEPPPRRAEALEPEPDFSIGVEEPPAVAAQIDEASLEDLMTAEALAEPEEPRRPEPQRVAVTHDASALAGVSLAEIEPQLRKQLHDTLEKIAWESFGDVTAQIVRQAVERVERVAWEVIPQLAETLIREEIRKLKGEGD